jgi:hypothetical protein
MMLGAIYLVSRTPKENGAHAKKEERLSRIVDALFISGMERSETERDSKTL